MDIFDVATTSHAESKMKITAKSSEVEEGKAQKFGAESKTTRAEFSKEEEEGEEEEKEDKEEEKEEEGEVVGESAAAAHYRQNPGKSTLPLPQSGYTASKPRLTPSACKPE